MRLINANELRDVYSGVPNGVFTTSHIITAIDECETVDAVPVVHGRWEPSDYNGFVRCSVCRDCYIDDTWTTTGKWQYCPNCGAKMDGGETDADGT